MARMPSKKRRKANRLRNGLRVRKARNKSGKKSKVIL